LEIVHTMRLHVYVKMDLPTHVRAAVDDVNCIRYSYLLLRTAFYAISKETIILHKREDELKCGVVRNEVNMNDSVK
jgi:hypothetical protein